MIIGVDGNEANVTKRVGVSFYCLNLLYYFKKKSHEKIRFVVYLKNKPLEDLPKENSNFKYRVVPGKFLWSQVFLPLDLLIHRKINIFFSPAHYTPKFCPVPTIVTIHDLSFLYYPGDFLKKDLYKLVNWTKESIKKVNKIIAVSKTTKKDIVKEYDVDENKIEVIYNGYEKDIKILGGTNKFKSVFNKPFILYVGTLQPRKNIATLIQSFAMFNKIYPTYELIIAGKKGWMYKQIFNEVVDLGLDKKVFFTDYVSDKQLAFLYRNAFCFVLPSLYEGFGIPILEAMSFDCPVISSFSSSLSEIGSDACLYFDPKNPNDLKEKFIELKENDNLRKDLIIKGKKRVKNFSWESCAKQTLDVIIKAYEDKDN